MSSKGYMRFTLVLAALILVVQHADARQSKVRKLKHLDAPITSQLRPDDEIVDIEYWEHVDYIEYPDETNTQTIARISREADTIAVVHVTNVEPFFVEGDSWIRTRVTFRVDQSLKLGTALKAGGRIEALYDGGEMRIKNVLVRADNYPELRGGSRYLLFVKPLGGDPWIMHIFELETGKGTRRPNWLRNDELPKNPFENQSQTTALKEIQNALKARQ